MVKDVPVRGMQDVDEEDVDEEEQDVDEDDDDFDFAVPSRNRRPAEKTNERKGGSLKTSVVDSLTSSRPTVVPARFSKHALHFLACFSSKAEFDNALRSYHLTLRNGAGFVNLYNTSSDTCVSVVCSHQARKLGGARAPSFVENLSCDLYQNACACGFICQAQRIPRKRFLMRQWRTTPLASKCPTYVSGSPASKKTEQVRTLIARKHTSVTPRTVSMWTHNEPAWSPHCI